MLLRYEEKIDMVVTNWNMSIVFWEYLFCGKRNFFFCDMAYWSIVFWNNILVLRERQMEKGSDTSAKDSECLHSGYYGGFYAMHNCDDKSF